LLGDSLIVDGHGTTQIVIPPSAQVGNLVAGLSDRIAEANENHRRNGWSDGFLSISTLGQRLRNLRTSAAKSEDHCD